MTRLALQEKTGKGTRLETLDQLWWIEDKTGFNPEKYNLTEQQAAVIASVFSKYDGHQAFRLELSEFRKLW